MTFILCGLPKCGKTTFGRLLAEKLQRPFIDIDELIERTYHLKTEKKNSCREIFHQVGESTFRDLETQQIASLNITTPTVIATGGGCFNRSENIHMLKKIGTIIYLKVDLALLWKRIENSGVPAYLDPKNPEQAFYKMCEQRIPLYEKAANCMIELNSMFI